MNINQIRFVKAVAETGSFTLAAEQCHVTQPTLSNGIAQLEQEFETKTFTRTTRTVSLTDFGKYLLPYIDKALMAQSELLRMAHNFKKTTQKIIRIGTSPIICSQWLVPMIESFRNAHPDIEIILHELNMADLYRMLEDGLLDFIFGVEDSKKSSWQTLPLYQEPLYFIPRSSHVLDNLKTVTLNDIANETFVMVPNVCGLATTTRALFRKNRQKLKEYSGEALSYQVLEEWATLGLGAAILPKSKLQKTRRKAYAITDKKGVNVFITMTAYWSNTLTSHLSKEVKHLTNFISFLTKYNEKILK